jgi:hypothetical protein
MAALATRRDAILAALLTGLIAIAAAAFSGYLSYHYGTVSQDRQVRLDQIAKFDSASSQLIEAAGSFVTAINGHQDLDPSRLKVRIAVANELQQADGLRRIFGGGIDKLVTDYQGALTEFNQVADKTRSVTDMRPWAESFGRVLDVKSDLSKELSVSMGLEPIS